MAELSPAAQAVLDAIAEEDIWTARRPEPQEVMIPDQYKGHQVHVYRAGFHAGYTHGLTRAKAALLAQPKPPSLKEQALQALNDAVKMADDAPPEGIRSDQADTIRRALESIPDHS